MIATISTLGLALFAFVRPSPAASNDPVPEITIRMPGPDSAELSIEATHRVGAYVVPWTYASIRIHLSGYKTARVRADERGFVRIPLLPLWRRVSKRGDLIVILADAEGRRGRASCRLDLRRAQIEVWRRARSGRLRREAETHLAAGRYEPAILAALGLIETSPEEAEGFYLLARARDRKGDALYAMVAYRQYLLHPKATAERMRLAKLRSIENFKLLGKIPPLPPVAVEHLRKGAEFESAHKWKESYEEYRRAQRIAPWWDEPYHRAALVQVRAWMDARAAAPVVTVDFDLLFAFGALSKDSERMRHLHRTVIALRDAYAKSSRRWAEVQRLLKENKDLLREAARKGVQTRRR